MKLTKANILINRKFVIEKSRLNIFIDIKDNIWNCSKGAYNICIWNKRVRTFE
jgi:hypothetical protein